MKSKLLLNATQRDEKANIKLAEELVKSENQKDIAEIVLALQEKNKIIANDAIKVLYEIGERKPMLIAEYTQQFLDLLSSKNSRLVWGAMSALAEVASLRADIIFEQLDKVYIGYNSGSVIASDQSMTVLARLCMANERYKQAIFPFLIEHLSKCRAKEVAQHAERISICINTENKSMFLEVLNSRHADLSDTQWKRVQKLINELVKEER